VANILLCLPAIPATFLTGIFYSNRKRTGTSCSFGVRSRRGFEPAVQNITSKLRVYPLKDAENPAATEFVNMSMKPFNTVFSSNFTYFEDLNKVIQDEPLDAVSPEVRGAIAAIGIVKGKPFAPDARMKKLLTEAATLGNATARAITYHPRIAGVSIYPDDPKSVWSTAFANKNTSFEADGIMGLDARVLYYFNAGGVTPAMAATIPGAGSDYGLAVLDANKQPFDGSKTYRLHLPKDVPVKDFWAVTIYDTQTRSQLQTGQPISDHRQPDQRHDPECRRLLRRVFCAQGTRGQRRQLAPDRSGEKLVHDPAHVRPAGALD
jgi:hypothetical protein